MKFFKILSKIKGFQLCVDFKILLGNETQVHFPTLYKLLFLFLVKTCTSQKVYRNL
jgi:hypothetical protein